MQVDTSVVLRVSIPLFSKTEFSNNVSRYTTIFLPAIDNSFLSWSVLRAPLSRENQCPKAQGSNDMTAICFDSTLKNNGDRERMPSPKSMIHYSAVDFLTLHFQ